MHDKSLPSDTGRVASLHVTIRSLLREGEVFMSRAHYNDSREKRVYTLIYGREKRPPACSLKEKCLDRFKTECRRKPALLDSE